jgi:hypothetical protein
MGENCKNCAAYGPAPQPLTRPRPDGPHDIGTCRLPRKSDLLAVALVRPDDWCRKWTEVEDIFG